MKVKNTEAMLNVFASDAFILRVDELNALEDDDYSKFNIYCVVSTNRCKISSYNIDNENNQANINLKFGDQEILASIDLTKYISDKDCMPELFADRRSNKI